MNPEIDSQERSYPERFEWNGELRYKLYHHSEDRPYQAAAIHNIGTTGLNFINSELIPVGSVLILKLFHHQDYSPIKVLAKVKWCDEAPEHEGYYIDCQFHDLSRDEQGLINDMVEEICFIRRIRSTFHKSLTGISYLKLSNPNGEKKNRPKRARKKTRKTNRAA